ncbi:MAG: nuclear transport factor 2 family protein [Candidatus Hodarchaeota archaeon]
MKTSEVENIQKSLDIFVDGLRTLNYSKICEIFFDKGLSCGSVKGEVNFVYRDHWKVMAEEAKAKGEDHESSIANYSIKSLNIIGNAASVIIDLSFGTDAKTTERYIDFYHMLKIKDKWLIISKIFPTDIERGRIEE